MKVENYAGKKVVVNEKYNGIIVGSSQRFNGSYVVLVNGESKEVHHENIRDLEGSFLKWIP